MSNITYTDKVAGASGVTGQWRAVDANEVKSVVNSKADSLGAVVTHTGTSWDGTPVYRQLTANLALTFATTRRSGYFIIKQDATGSRTLTINGTSIPISSTANSYTVLSFTYNDATSTYVFAPDTSIVVLTGGDATPPTLVSATIENAAPAKIVLTYSEALDTGSVPTTGQFNVTVDAISASIASTAVVGSTVEVTLSTAVTTGQVVVIGYSTTGNPIQDAAGNDAAGFSGQSVTNNVSGGGYDTDAVAVITAIEATGPTLTTGQKNAINGRIVALKAQSKWTNMKAYYGFVGGTAAAHAINWKSPGTFNITWNGTITHSATGVLFDGSTGYGDTGLNDNTVLGLDDVSIGGYSRTSTNTGFMMGILQTNGLYLADRNSMITRLHDVTDLTAAMTPTRTIMATRQTAAPKMGEYRDGTQLTVDATAAAGKINGNIYVGAINNLNTPGPGGFSDKSYGSMFIYNGGFTSGEAATFATDETTFQTALSRNV